MANTRNGNTFYIDTQYSSASDEYAALQVKVSSVTVTATASSGRVVLADSSTAKTKVDLRVATSGDSKMFQFDPPLLFPNGIRPVTLSNAVVTCVYQISG